MEKKQDLRVVKTREAIQNAFVQLIEEKGFEAMTIKDITEKARINRGTFYAHYQDKYHCLSSYESELLEGIVDIAKKHDPFRKTAGFESDSLPIAIDIFQYLDRNREMLKALLSPKGDPYFQSKLKQTTWELLYEKTAASLVDSEQMQVPPEFLASYISGAHLSVIQTWLDHGCKETPEEMAKILSVLTVKGPLRAAGLIRR